MILAAVQAAAAAAAAFGFHLTAEQVGAITTVSALVLGLVARSHVSPVPAK